MVLPRGKKKDDPMLRIVRICSRIAGIVTLTSISGCANETITGRFGQTIRVMNDIRFQGVDRTQNGQARLKFTLTNRTNRALCFQGFSQSEQYGRIDYFVEDGASYFDRVAFSHWVPEINQPTEEALLPPTSAKHAIPPHSQLDIVRLMTPSVYRSYADVDMIAGTEFGGAFEGQKDLYAELEVYLHYCDYNDPQTWFETVPYFFKSGRVGPFRVSIPPEN